MQTENIIQNTWPILSESVKGRTDKERLKTICRLKETKEMWQLNAMCNSKVDLEQKKGISGRTGEIRTNFVVWLIVNQCQFLSFVYSIKVIQDVTVSQLYKMLTLDEVGEDYIIRTLHNLCNIFVILKLLQNKVLKKAHLYKQSFQHFLKYNTFKYEWISKDYFDKYLGVVLLFDQISPVFSSLPFITWFQNLFINSQNKVAKTYTKILSIFVIVIKVKKASWHPYHTDEIYRASSNLKAIWFLICGTKKNFTILYCNYVII